MKLYRSNLKYISGVHNSGGERYPLYSYSRVVKNKSSRYHNCQHLLIKLSKCAEMFLRYSTEIMDKENRFVNSVLVRQNFIEHMKKDCATSYKDDTVQSAINEIKAVGLYIKPGIRTVYIVNPLYYFNGVDSNRVKLISKLMQEAKTQPIHKDSNIIKALVVPVEAAKDK